MMKHKFKLIPFLISLLLVVGVTFGICWYSLFEYQINRNRFYEDYFHTEDYKNVETTTFIEEALKYNFAGYKKADSKVNIHKNNSNIFGKDVPTYNNGTIHVPGYFDIDIYAIDATASNSDDDPTYEYYFYFYNVQYTDKKGNLTISNNELPLAILSAVGTGSLSDKEAEETDSTNLYGDSLIDYAINKINDSGTLNITYNGAAQFGIGTNGSSSIIYPIYDNGATNTPDGDTMVWRCSPRQDINRKDVFESDDNEDGTMTFSIVLLPNDDECVELVRGTITDLDKLDEIDYNLGANGDIFSNNALKSTYFKYIWLRVAVHGLIAFVISGVIGTLFYLVWIDGGNTDDAPKATKKKKIKNKG